MREDARYDVALSFAGEERPYVEAVADALRNAGVKVFYDDYEKVTLWGKDLYSHLDYVYRKASRYCVLFVSESYARKVWTNHERQSAQARALEENLEYVLPTRFDATELPGLRPTIGYLDLTAIAAVDLAKMVQEKLGPKRLTPGFPQKIGRLHQKLDLRGERAKDAKKEAWLVAHSFYEALRRMTLEERRAVAGAFAFGCIGELPDGIHISLDYLSRMTKMPQAEVLEALASVRSLNVKLRVRDPKDVHPLDIDEYRAEDKDLLVSFWSGAAPRAKDPTRIAYYAVREASRHFCADHGLDVIVGLDFHRLSGDESGLLAMPDHDAEHPEPDGAPQARS